MRVAIVGAGALGGFYGAMLARKSYDVHFLMRRDFEAVSKKGLTVQSSNGDFHLEQVNCYRRTDQIGPVELVFIGLKTTANSSYEQLIPPLLGANTRIVTAQNGLGNEELLAELFGAERVAGALAFLCSNRTEPGVINHLDYGFLNMGNYQRTPDETLRELNEMFNQCGVESKLTDNLALARWKKLIWNVPFSGLSTLLDKTVDKIMNDADLRAKAERLMKEVQLAAAAHKLVIEDGFLEHMLFLTHKMIPYHTSMHLDRLNHQPLELEAIVGEPLRRGRKYGLEFPEMEALYEGLSVLDRKIS